MTDMALVASIALGGNAFLALFRPRPAAIFTETFGDRLRDAVFMPLGCLAIAFLVAAATGARPQGLANPPALAVYAFTGLHALVFAARVRDRWKGDAHVQAEVGEAPRQRPAVAPQREFDPDQYATDRPQIRVARETCAQCDVALTKGGTGIEADFCEACWKKLR